MWVPDYALMSAQTGSFHSLGCELLFLILAMERGLTSALTGLAAPCPAPSAVSQLHWKVAIRKDIDCSVQWNFTQAQEQFLSSQQRHNRGCMSTGVPASPANEDCTSSPCLPNAFSRWRWSLMTGEKKNLSFVVYTLHLLRRGVCLNFV